MTNLFLRRAHVNVLAIFGMSVEAFVTEWALAFALVKEFALFLVHIAAIVFKKLLFLL